MFIQGGLLVAFTMFGVVLFFLRRGRGGQGQPAPDAQGMAAGFGIVFVLLFLAVGVVIILLAVRLGRLSSGARVGALLIEGVLGVVRGYGMIRNPSLIPILQFAIPAIIVVLLFTGGSAFAAAKGTGNGSRLDVRDMELGQPQAEHPDGGTT